jgi:hypothetical protein
MCNHSQHIPSIDRRLHSLLPVALHSRHRQGELRNTERLCRAFVLGIGIAPRDSSQRCQRCRYHSCYGRPALQVQRLDQRTYSSHGVLPALDAANVLLTSVTTNPESGCFAGWRDDFLRLWQKRRNRNCSGSRVMNGKS